MLDVDLANMQSRQSVSEALKESIPETSFRESLLTNLTRKDGGFAWKPNLQSTLCPFRNHSNQSLERG